MTLYGKSLYVISKHVEFSLYNVTKHFQFSIKGRYRILTNRGLI